LKACANLPCEDECVPMGDPACPPALEAWDYERPFENLDSVFSWLLLRIAVPWAVLCVLYQLLRVCRCPGVLRININRVRRYVRHLNSSCNQWSFLPSERPQLGDPSCRISQETYTQFGCTWQPFTGAQVFISVAATLKMFRPAASLLRHTPLLGSWTACLVSVVIALIAAHCSASKDKDLQEGTRTLARCVSYIGVFVVVYSVASKR
jgi:hypothetical protein